MKKIKRHIRFNLTKHLGAPIVPDKSFEFMKSDSKGRNRGMLQLWDVSREKRNRSDMTTTTTKGKRKWKIKDSEEREAYLEISNK